MLSLVSKSVGRWVWLIFAAGVLYAQDPLEIVRRSLDRDANNAERLKNYTFIERQEERSYDKNGKLTKTESETGEILMLSGRPYSRTIEKNDKPLAEKDARREQEKLDKESAKRQRESSGEKARLEKERAEDRRFLKELPDAFNFRLVGTEPVSGKLAWVIEATPKPGYKPKDSRAKLLTKLRGKLWIDQGEYQWVKIDAEVLDTISWGLGLLRIAPGGTLHFEQKRMNEEVWVPSSLLVRAEARVGFIKKLRAEFDVTYRDYKKFQTDSRIVSGEEVRP